MPSKYPILKPKTIISVLEKKYTPKTPKNGVFLSIKFNYFLIILTSKKLDKNKDLL